MLCGKMFVKQMECYSRDVQTLGDRIIISRGWNLEPAKFFTTKINVKCCQPAFILKHEITWKEYISLRLVFR